MYKNISAQSHKKLIAFFCLDRSRKSLKKKKNVRSRLRGGGRGQGTFRWCGGNGASSPTGGAKAFADAIEEGHLSDDEGEGENHKKKKKKKMLKKKKEKVLMMLEPSNRMKLVFDQIFTCSGFYYRVPAHHQTVMTTKKTRRRKRRRRRR